MIIGNSMDATLYKIYKRLDDSNEYEKVSYLDRLDEFENDDMYELVDYEAESYIPDDEWDQSQSYKSGEINTLIECDYCGEFFTLTDKVRMDRANSHRGSLRLAGFEIETGEFSFYKDNCEDCHYEKVKETMLLTKGFSNPFLEEDVRIKRANAFKLTNDVKTSRGQRYLADIFQGELNQQIGYYFADIVIDDKIIIEYDGGGHDYCVKIGQVTKEQFNKRERQREQYLINKGYKILRFVSSADLFPEENKTISIVSEAIANLLLSDYDISTINIGTKANDKVYGKLKPIKKILEKSKFGGGNIEN